MPQAIMSVLEKILVDSWTTETAKAWTDLWDTSATAMMKADPRNVLNVIAIGLHGTATPARLYFL